MGQQIADKGPEVNPDDSPTSPLDAGSVLDGVPVAVEDGRLSALYKEGRSVGKGGYATVYKGVRKSDNQPVAIKKVQVFDMPTRKRERCFQEVRLFKALSHPHIIAMHEAFLDKNELVIVLEWAAGGDLKRLVRRAQKQQRKLHEVDIWAYFTQIACAVRYMHGQRIMHRDLKPANVMLAADGTLKVGDLGLGRELEEGAQEAISKVGTPYYVSPEVVRGSRYSWNSDVWSLGCILYELASLRSPFEVEGADMVEVFRRITRCEYAPLPDEPYSHELRSLAVRMLRQDPSLRPSIDEVHSSAARTLARLRDPPRPCGTAADGRAVALAPAVHHRLLQLAAQVQQLRGSCSASGSLSGTALPQPPPEMLPLLHPYLFALPAAPAGADRAPPARTNAVAMALAWLLQLLPSSRSSPAGAAARQLQEACCRGGRAAEAGEAAAQALLAQLPQAGVDVAACSPAGLLYGGDASACLVLQQLLQAARTGLPACQRPRGRPVRDAKPVPEAAGKGAEEVLEEEGGGGGPGKRDTEADFDPRVGRPQRSRGSEAVGKDCASMPPHQVDREAWRLECQRLSAELVERQLQLHAAARSTPPSAAAAATPSGEAAPCGGAAARVQQHAVHEQLQATLAELQTARSRAGLVQLVQLAKNLGEDMAPILQLEQRINDSAFGELAAEYAARRRSLQGKQACAAELRHTLTQREVQLHRLAGELEEVRQAIRSRVADISSSQELHAAQAALAAVNAESVAVEARLQRARQLLSARSAAQRVRALAATAAGSSNE